MARTAMSATRHGLRRAGLAMLAIALFGAPGDPARSAPATAAAVASRTADLPVGRITFRDSGGPGVPVLFLNPGSASLWDGQVAAVTGAGFRFVALDYRTAVATDGPAPSAEAQIEALTALLKIGRFHLVGTGGGAVAAMQYALHFPARVRSLTVGNSLVGLRDETFNTLERRLRSPQFDAMPREWRELGPSYRATQPEGVQRWLELTPPPSASPPASGAPPAASASPVTWERLDQLHVPLLMVTGDADPYTPPAILRAFVRRMKGSEGTVVADSGHASYWENPSVYNRALIGFLRKH